MDIIRVSVPVIIHSVIRNLISIDPHIGSQVRMVPLDRLVYHCNNHRRVSGTQPPHIFYIYICSCPCSRSNPEITDILIVPLVRERRIIKGSTGRCSCRHCRAVLP